MSEKKTILVVDDELDITTYLTTLLEDNGYATLTATDGVQAMDLLRSKKPDLVTLDMSMPKKSGVKTFKEIKEDPDLKQTPVIIVTAIGEPMKTFMNRRSQLVEPEGFIAKPIDEQEFLDMVKDLLA